MKNKGLIITLISILTIVTIFVSVLFILLLNGKLSFKNIKFGFNKTSTTKIYSKEFDPSFSNISIKSDVADIKVEEYDGDTIKVVVYGDKEDSKLKVKDSDILDIDFKVNSCKFLCFGTTKGNIEVYLPSAYKNSVGIKNDVGNIKIGSINISTLTTDTDVGDVKIHDFEGKIKIDTDTGDVDLKNVTITKDSKITSDVGDISITGINDIRIDADTDVGDVKIKNNNKHAYTVLEIETDTGDIEVK